MIILDEEPSSKLGSSDVSGPTLRFPERAAGRSTLTLPDYETSQAIANHNFGYKQVVTRKVDVRYGFHKSSDSFVQIHIFDGRFWRATLYALLIYIALSLIVGIPIVVTVSCCLPMSLIGLLMQRIRS
jgi:hypothetical protein